MKGEAKNVSNPFMIINILSYQADTMGDAFDIAKYFGRVDKSLTEKMLLKIPRGNPSWITYPRRTKINYSHICNAFNCGEEEAAAILALAELQDIDIGKLLGEKK
jgi:hypothetical protein